MVRYWNYPKRRYRRSYAAVRRRRTSYRKRKSMRKAAPLRSLDNHCYKRWANSLAYNWTDLQGNSIQNTYQASLDKLVNYSDFTTLYDQYRILKVVMKVRLVGDPSAQQMPNNASLVNAANIYPRLWYCPDHDDTASETWTQLRERAKTKCKVLQPNKMITTSFRPAVLGQLYRTAVTTGYGPKYNQWIDVAGTDVPHYGIKWSIEAAGFTPLTNYPYSFQFDFIYYIQCKGTR